MENASHNRPTDRPTARRPIRPFRDVVHLGGRPGDHRPSLRTCHGARQQGDSPRRVFAIEGRPVRRRAAGVAGNFQIHGRPTDHGTASGIERAGIRIARLRDGGPPHGDAAPVGHLLFEPEANPQPNDLWNRIPVRADQGGPFVRNDAALDHQARVVEISGLERTILDGLRQPEYCGGVTEVAKGMWMRRDGISIPKLVEYCLRLDIGAVTRRLGHPARTLRTRHRTGT